MQNDVLQLDCQAIRECISAGRITSLAATEAALAAIDRHDAQIGAYITVFPEQARQKAKEIDAKIAAGEPVGALAGVPIAVKDNMCMTQGPTTCASKILANFHAPYDATVIQKLQDADAVILGKTNLDEFAMGSSTETSGLKQTVNPWDTTRVPGGSSGGSAAAVGAHLCFAALGSDTGGSIRQPASFCGVVGLKPTYGIVSRYGLVAYGSSLDQIGPLARSVADCGLVMNVIAGHDPKDSTSVDDTVTPSVDYLTQLDQSVDGLAIGVVPALTAGADAEVSAAIALALDLYQQQGARLVEVDLPHADYAIAAYYTIATAEASSNLARYDGVHYGHRAENVKDTVEMYSKSRAEGFGPEVKRRIMLGTYALSSGYYDAYYLKALKVRNLIRRDFTTAFEKCDCIAMPVSPSTAFKLGEKTADPLQMYLADIYTISANLAGIPGLSLPCGFDTEGMPIGLQLLGPAFDEAKLLRIAQMYQKQTDWHNQIPTL